MEESLERITGNISKIESRIHDLEDDLYHIRLEIETLIKSTDKTRKRNK